MREHLCIQLATAMVGVSIIFVAHIILYMGANIHVFFFLHEFDSDKPELIKKDFFFNKNLCSDY